ncbi:MAG: hypothetical protein WKF78_06340 [Candidatus Limnocylindrales bacterium]
MLDAQTALAQYICAHVTRHGPLMARKESAKLAMMMSANGDPAAVVDFKNAASTRTPEAAHAAVATGLTEALFEAWALEQGPAQLRLGRMGARRCPWCLGRRGQGPT